MIDIADKERFLEALVLGGECWTLKLKPFNTGYARIRIRGKSKQGHRISWEIFVGPIPPELDVLHKCDNPACVRPLHLFLGTHQENMKDRDRKSRQCKGVRHWNYRITEDIQEKFFKEYTGRHGNLKKLALKYGFSKSTANRLINEYRTRRQ